VCPVTTRDSREDRGTTDRKRQTTQRERKISEWQSEPQRNGEREIAREKKKRVQERVQEFKSSRVQERERVHAKSSRAQESSRVQERVKRARNQNTEEVMETHKEHATNTTYAVAPVRPLHAVEVFVYLSSSC
jgi:hypothetical protein